MDKSKNCIFDYNKLCNNCGECDICDIDHNKKCDNCGRCLEEEGYDMKSIKIDKVVLNKDKTEEELILKDSEVNEKEDLMSEKCNDQCKCQNDEADSGTENIKKDENQKDSNIDNWKPDIEYIDDIEGLNDLLNDVKKLDEVAVEEFPGLIRLKNNRYKN
ncbi:hypothetical protein D4Z93_07060 [Clostridium fermenticellae]|uniref:Uncharacterized protein n=1 Tax=Clostridium fermenticellae TaxID=2068654 RepID=A0A386H3I9_9CLOT|nr:hypothetical protein [Clostridium fermenticellae]AYD40291.1 hypothetical protein D4Z93_07060 [Clostridium fermenticellae]